MVCIDTYYNIVLNISELFLYCMCTLLHILFTQLRNRYFKHIRMIFVLYVYITSYTFYTAKESCHYITHSRDVHWIEDVLLLPQLDIPQYCVLLLPSNWRVIPFGWTVAENRVLVHSFFLVFLHKCTQEGEFRWIRKWNEMKCLLITQ
jgi:hypothetical protein